MIRFFFFILGLGCALPLLAAPQVVVTLKPIHSLVASLMQGVAEPQLLLPDGASPHTFHLKPSTLKQLQHADLIIWVGPSLETFLIKPLADMKTSRILTLSTLPTLTQWPLRHGREWAAHSHEHTHENHSADFDPHIWLSLDNAEKMAIALTQQLIQLDPSHQTQYETNSKALQQQLSTLKQTLITLLTPVKNKPFLVYHDGYQYFEKEFGLDAKGTMILNPHLPLSAQGLKTIKKMIREHHIHCVFRETEFNDTLIQNSLAIPGVQVAELDPLGVHYPKGPKNYEQTLLALGDSLSHCLKSE